MEGTPGSTHGGRALRADGRQVHQDNAADVPSENELKTALEKGSDEQKIETMVRLQHCTALHCTPHCTPRASAAAWLTTEQKKILAIMLNGDAKTGLLMHIIRFVMPSKSKPLKKLMYFFFEVCPKHDAQGKLRQEWILVWCVEHEHAPIEDPD